LKLECSIPGEEVVMSPAEAVHGDAMKAGKVFFLGVFTA
jgi:hypothetical protein